MCYTKLFLNIVSMRRYISFQGIFKNFLNKSLFPIVIGIEVL